MHTPGGASSVAVVLGFFSIVLKPKELGYLARTPEDPIDNWKRSTATSRWQKQFHCFVNPLETFAKFSNNFRSELLYFFLAVN